MVVIAHSSEYLLRLINARYIGNAAHWFFDQVHYSFGLLGVELFFVLSGFLIGNILIKTFINSPFSFSDVRNFWVRRWFRTLPLYWLVLTANIILYAIIHHEVPAAYKFSYYFFLQNLWYPHPPYFFGESWSLSVEEWFYITLPVAMYLSALIFHPSDKKKFLLRVFVAYLAVFLLTRFFNAFHPINGPDQDTGIRKVVVFRLDAVMYGVLIAYFNNYSSHILNRLKNYLFLIGISGTIFIFYLLTNTSVNITASSSPAIRFSSDAFLYLFIPLFFSLCLPYAYNIKTLKNKYAAAFFGHISKISYSMYLVHYTLIFITYFCYMKSVSMHAAAAYYVLYWVIVITLSSILYKYFESPIMRLRDKFSKK